MIDAVGSEEHYAANVRPVLEAVPRRLQGTIYRTTPPDDAGPVVVSSYNDLRQVVGRPVAFMEHGTGQTYGDNLASYADSDRRPGVRLFLCPSDRVAHLNREHNPRIPAIVVGCPKLDPWWDVRPADGVVGLSWHWDAAFCPEGTSALPFYAEKLATLARTFPTIGTAHPRIATKAMEVYEQADIEWVTAEQMYERASVLVADNTSLGWEFIAMDRPVVWCNSPSYRRFINHGLRFWDYVDAGIEIDEPAELVRAVDKALHRDEKHARRMEVAPDLYAYRDNGCAARAVAAILEHLGG